MLAVGLILVAAMFLSLSHNQKDITWSHRKDNLLGPQNWANTFQLCGADMQSPIDIRLESVVFDRNLQPFDFSDYGLTDKLNITLNDYSDIHLKMYVKGAQIFLKGGSLPDEYQLVQFHFHWGAESSRGSEHSIDGKFKPMEVHFVHITKMNVSTSEVMRSPYGLAVIGFFFKVGKHNENYESVLRYIDQARSKDKRVAMETFPLSKLLPTSKSFDYYRYFGSLTTPPCFQTVIWSVGVDEIEISEEQLNKFRQLLSVDNKPVVDNFRPIQKLNHRSVFTNRRSESSKSCPIRTPFGSQAVIVVLVGAILTEKLSNAQGYHVFF